ncbi:hypothetical protein E2C01_025657 [Portunus trituberculatus]|uniref:Uncharacterized protein n=1 Tax=Portunus trituberculatus TaxID=210409 RepID=A0A5B7EGA8_PORTR|nr:hypothetical protein [Portunus trituberculatus]
MQSSSSAEETSCWVAVCLHSLVANQPILPSHYV